MKLYDGITPNSLRVNVFLAEKGIDIPRVQVNVLAGETRTEEFLAKNSRGEIPLIEMDDGRLLAESIAICRYLEEQHPEPSLFGGSSDERAFTEMWNRRMESHIFGPIGAFGLHTFEFFADKMEQFTGYGESQARLFDQNLKWLDKEMSDGRAYITGDTFSVADITGMAALVVCDFAERALPDGLMHVKRWEEAMRKRPSFAKRFADMG